MNVDRNKKRPLIVLHEETGQRKSHRPDNEISSELDSDNVFNDDSRYRRDRKFEEAEDFLLKNSIVRDGSIERISRFRGGGKEPRDVPRKDNTEDSVLKLKRKKKRRCLTICTTNCKYEAVRRVAARFGMKEVTEESSWNLYWTDLSVSIERAKDMKRYQKVNHFPGMTEICRKDLLARNLNRMLKLFPGEYNFFPKTWCFPADHSDAINYARQKRSKTFIIKPESGCQGRGIYLTKNLKDVKPTDRMICQVYVAKPFLIDGYKFDFRIYTLITSCDPLRIYAYNDGLVRFATSRYKEPTGHNTSNVFMHLTNYAVNKHSRMYVSDDESGSKRKISTLNKLLRLREIDVDDLWCRIDEIIVKTVLAAYPILKHSYRTCFPTHDRTYACFELLGFDVLLDWRLKPYLLEVNHSPSFHTEAQIDKDIKEGLLADTFEMLNLNQCDKRKIIEEDRRRIRDRLLQGLNPKDSSPNESSSGCGLAKSEKPEEGTANCQLRWEEEHMGNFRRIYPCPGSDKYEPFFRQNYTSVFQETVASRAREEAARIQKEENEMKNREEESKRVTGKWSEGKLNPESPYALKKVQASGNNPERPKFQPRKSCLTNIQRGRQSSSLSSFEPEVISESEERERVTGLAQRDFLIKSYGLLEQIYLAMRKNGTLREADEKKYGLYGKLSNDSNRRSLRYSQHHYRHRGPLIEGKFESLVDQSSQYPLKGKREENAVNYNCSCSCSCSCDYSHDRNYDCGCQTHKDLGIGCNEAPVYVREKFTTEDHPIGYEPNRRITKAHVARTLSNTVRLYTLQRRENLSKFK